MYTPTTAYHNPPTVCHIPPHQPGIPHPRPHIICTSTFNTYIRMVFTAATCAFGKGKSRPADSFSSCLWTQWWNFLLVFKVWCLCTFPQNKQLFPHKTNNLYTSTQIFAAPTSRNIIKYEWKATQSKWNDAA